MTDNAKALLTSETAPDPSIHIVGRQLRKLVESLQSEVGLHMARARRLELLASALGATKTQLDTINREARADMGFA